MTAGSPWRSRKPGEELWSAAPCGVRTSIDSITEPEAQTSSASLASIMRRCRSPDGQMTTPVDRAAPPRAPARSSYTRTLSRPCFRRELNRANPPIEPPAITISVAFL